MGASMPPTPDFTILKTGHVELRVTDLERACAFYDGLLGFVETERDDDRVYLRCLEDWEHHSLILTRADAPGLGHIAYRVASERDLDALHRLATERGLPTRWVEPGEERGQGRALRIQDPLGFPVEFYHAVERVPRMLQRFHEYRGPHVMRVDHVNLQVPDVDAGTSWYRDTLGFYCSEYTETEDTPPRLWAVWLHRKQNVHDVALMTGPGPRLHHVGFWLPESSNVLRAADILSAAGYEASIERGPGRHGISNAMFLYLRDPDGNRVELYTCDYLIADPDFEPIRWRLNDPKRQTYWGHPAPPSWFNDASHVATFDGDGYMPIQAPAMADRPSYVGH
ncbi:3,4-dihydroxyphenylacetate 2,3-dioxygenase [Sphaerobacter thermophilus]|uniref:3,4-dihydroxyphenylacetate 2,3-dioxygenase n=1 Tax=Sphaerobacter thermophilus (strain ATCC 49802 / DSM 20745 / KCCM 41009 / NCIMB 13125 / S 6022) TaxID=479434 RepID=D1C8S6_SPHTD|nr:3,4-dihydroxyphenylacetate 2,3-dioxygenase [Sphaerobacter thermophilus]ACZ40219.1 3,4-dihydroxyphenylacetate 2,3-dioxygenase [Sphaerobacter thermophilus DSM 20745]